MRFLYPLLLTCILLSFVHRILAQVPKPPSSVQSPNVASLGLFGDMPVSLASGLANIDLPLYELRENAIQIPVTLSYHASGFRPDVHPGWVGLGWALSCGGAVSRIVKDMPDDYRNVSLDPGGVAVGFLWNYSALGAANWDQPVYMRTIARTFEMLKDTEPDEFSFSYPGGSGSFYLDHQGNWKVKCDKPVKVTFNNQFLDVPFPIIPYATVNWEHGNFRSFAGFTVTDELGNQYLYGYNTQSIEYQIGFFSQAVDEWVAQTWHLTKIIHADGYEVNLTYEKDDFINQMYVSIFMDLGTRTSASGSIFDPQPSCSSSSYGSSEYYYYDGKLISPSYLKTINSSSGAVMFDRSTTTELRYSSQVYAYRQSLFQQNPPLFIKFLPFLDTDVDYPASLDKLQWKKLDKIRILDVDGNLERSFSFSYNNKSTERLRLLSITETGSNDEPKPSFEFSYNADPSVPYLACKTDHWGFYNGVYANISDQSTFMNTYYGYREPNSTALQACVLNKITYPTGGVTEFTYEPHQYNKRLQVNRTDGIDPSFNTKTMAGGLRIKKISSYDVLNPDVKQEKEYFYVNGYSNGANVNNLPSSGVLGGQIKYYFDDYRTVAFNDNNIQYSKSIFSSQSVLPASENSVGTHIGYSEVTEKLADGSYARHFFTNFDNGHIDEPVPSLQLTRTAYEPASSLALQRGVLQKREEYSGSNVLLRKVELEYEQLNKNNEYVRALSARYFNVCESTAVSAEEGVAYRLYTYSYLPKTEITTEYDENGQNPLVTRKEMTYHTQHRQLKEESVRDSKAQLAKVYYRYPYDVLSYTPSGAINANQTTAYMIQHNMIGRAIEILRTKTVGTTEYITGGNVVNYKSFSGLAKPATIYQFESVTPPTRGSYTSYAVTGYSGTESINKDSRMISSSEYLAYDSRGNVSNFYKTNDKKQSFIWDYNEQVIVAEVDNAMTDQIAYTSFETSSTGGWIAATGGNYLTNNGNMTGNRSFSGQLSKTVPAGSYVVTLWGLQSGTQTVNGQVGTVLATSGNRVLKKWNFSNPGTVTVTGNNIDEVRLHPENAQMLSYTYNPLVGITSANDVNNQITFYEYDGLGRLKMVRDRERNLLRKIVYNYRGEPDVTYYNSAISGSFTKDCFALGSSVQYEVPAETYSSVISQAEADEMARQDFEINGQRNANLNGICDDTPLDLKYATMVSGTITLSFENTYTHKVYNFSVNQTATTLTVFGSLPKGWYNVTVTVPGTGPHFLGVGTNWRGANGVVTFTNIRMLYELDYMVVINY